MSKELEEAYHITALDFASSGDQEMYDFYMNEMVELTRIPEDAFNKDLDNIRVGADIEREEKAYLKFINKLINNIF